MTATTGKLDVFDGLRLWPEKGNPDQGLVAACSMHYDEGKTDKETEANAERAEARAFANAAKLASRWNAFEPGGIVSRLRENIEWITRCAHMKGPAGAKAYFIKDSVMDAAHALLTELDNMGKGES